MLFNSYIFFLFLLATLLVYYLISDRKYKKIFLLAGSYFFYGYWDWRFCSLLLISTIIDYNMGRRIHASRVKRKRKLYLLVSLFSNLGILGFFKYFNFFVDTFSQSFDFFGADLDYLHINIILPVGISFYTFQTLSYTIDIYKEKLKPTPSFLDFSLFVAFFPQLVAGPIERAKSLLPQIRELSLPQKKQVRQGIVLIITGMFRKVIIGDTTGKIVDHIFADVSLYSSPELLMALILFSLQIYADFSGYSSIARGTAKLLGIELMKNFDQPYLASNITEFWRRWHISLSTWLRDYLYIPLGGNRKGTTRTYLNLMITMLLGGLWHGANWTFVIWGGLHGLYLSLHKLYLRGKKIQYEFRFTNLKGLCIYLVKVIATYLMVLFTWLFFRAGNFSDISYFVSKMIYWEPNEFSGRIIVICTMYLLLSHSLDFFEYYTKKHTYILRIRSAPLRLSVLTYMFLVVFLYMLQSDPLPFVYFQF